MLKEFSLEDIECGNLIFGHSRGNYQLPREEWQETFCNFLKDAGFDFYGHPEKDSLEKYINIEKDIFYEESTTDIKPDEIILNGQFSHLGPDNEDEFYYYNGDFYCIFREPEPQYFIDFEEWEDRYWELEDDKYDIFDKWLDENEMTVWDTKNYKGSVPDEIANLLKELGYPPLAADYKVVDSVRKVVPHMVHNHYFDNGTFVVRPYYWGNGETIATYPNFVYYPDGITFSWYKYPLRDAYTNKDLSYDKFCAILNKCLESLGEKKQKE